MRKIAMISLVSLLFSVHCRAEEVKWYGWNEAQTIAKEQNKPIMIFIYASWCHLCQRMYAKVFSDDEVAGLLNTDYIPVKLDAEFKGDLGLDGANLKALDLLSELTDNQFRGVPAYVFIPKSSDKQGNLVAGLKDPEEMRSLLLKFK